MRRYAKERLSLKVPRDLWTYKCIQVIIFERACFVEVKVMENIQTWDTLINLDPISKYVSIEVM